MKLVRYGAPGREKPGIIDADGKIRDLSRIVPDIDGAMLAAGGLAKIRKANLKRLKTVAGKPRLGPCVGHVRNYLAIGLNYSDHAAEGGNPIPKEPVVFNKAPSCICGPNDNTMIPKDSSKLVIELAGVLRDHGVVVRPADAARRLVKDDRLLRNRVTALGGVIGVIEPDREVIAHMADAGAEPRLAGDGLEPLEIGLPDLGEAAGGQHGAVDIRHDARQVPDFAVGVDDAGLLAAGRAIADEFHVGSSPSGVCFGVGLKGGSGRIMRWRRGRGQGRGVHASAIARIFCGARLRPAGFGGAASAF